MTATNPSTPASNDKFEGIRFLLDATGSRQYAITYKNGVPKPPIQVFDSAGQSSFKPGEKVFAFDDDVQTTSKDGALRVSTVAFQIDIDETGRPRRLKQQGVDYVMTFDTKPGVPPVVSYTIAPESLAALKQSGFDAAFPAKLSGSLAANDFDTQISKGGIIMPGAAATASSNAPFPPQHDGGALSARLYVETQHVETQPKTPANDTQAQKPKSAPLRRFSMPDDQTLVERKNLGDGDSLKIVFNFESRRVTEIVSGNRPANSFSFSEYGSEAVEAAAKQLKSMGGKPNFGGQSPG